MAELKYWIWMNELGINPYLARRVLEYFGSPKEAFFAERDDFAKVPGLERQEIEALSNKDLNHVYRIGDDMQALGGRILTQQDAEYPQRLLNIADAPLVLYVRGRLPVVDHEAAIVIAGTRRCSSYGLTAAAQIAGEVTRHGGLVVSGLALGVDAAAAEGALRAGGPVVGVLGCGIERVYPAENVALFESVLEHGAIVSEYPPGTEPAGHNFPRRNRIMTGLSVALVAVEIPTEKSGVMHSVRHAIEQGREVFVVPANIDAPTSRASNALLAEEGFRAAATGWHVLRDYERQFPKISQEVQTGKRIERTPIRVQAAAGKARRSTKKVIDKAPKEVYIDLEEVRKDRSEAERAVLDCLGQEPIHVDEIVAACALPVQTVSVCLTTLGIADYIREHPGKRYSLSPQLSGPKTQE